jgi:4-alpha-glucanotransferase
MSDRGAARFSTGRHAGVLVPLFSIPSERSWGVGEIPDLIPLARWLRTSGLDFVQLLPVNEMQEGQSSPYSALSAMAIDPLFVAIDQLDDSIAAGAEAALNSDETTELDRARRASRVDYAAVRALKDRALRRAFEWFARHLWGTSDRRARAFDAFQDRERWWLDDYVLFRALHEAHGGRHWREWDAGVRDRDRSALDAAGERLEWSIRYYAYLQWVADEQWQRVRMEAAPTGLFGDFPFMVSSHSADVWARQHEFDLESSVGTPPDAFSATGQDWRLPAYRWDVVGANGYAWLSDRTRRSCELYDGFRIDHVIGFYRTYVRRADGSAGFQPPDESAQRAQGERLLEVFSDGGASIIAEDLGSVPNYLHASLAAHDIPGMKVLRWERQWKVDGRPFRDPAAYPARSVATSGTHDTETMADWWDGADEAERQALARLPLLARAGVAADGPFSDRARDALLETLFASGSSLVIVPVQDIFGWRDRINTPASIGQQNWTWRLPGPVERLATDAGALERAAFLRALSRETGRHS